MFRYVNEQAYGREPFRSYLKRQLAGQ